MKVEEAERGRDDARKARTRERCGREPNKGAVGEGTITLCSGGASQWLADVSQLSAQ